VPPRNAKALFVRQWPQHFGQTLTSASSVTFPITTADACTQAVGAMTGSPKGAPRSIAIR